MKTTLKFSITVILLFVCLDSGIAQNSLFNFNQKKVRSVSFETFHQVDRLVVNEIGAKQLFFALFRVENFDVMEFDTRGFSIRVSNEKIISLGAQIKYGDRIKRWRNDSGTLRKGEQNYDDYFSLGLNSQINLVRVGSEKQNIHINIDQIGSLHYSHFKGYQQMGNPSNNKFQDEDYKGIGVNATIRTSLEFNVMNIGSVSFFYQPAGIEVATYVGGINFNGFGTSIQKNF